MTVKIDVKPLGPKSLAIAVSADEEVCVQWLGRTIFDSTHEGLADPGDDEDDEEEESNENDYNEDYLDEDEDNEDGDIHITFADGDDIYHTLLILRLL